MMDGIIFQSFIMRRAVFWKIFVDFDQYIARAIFHPNSSSAASDCAPVLAPADMS